LPAEHQIVAAVLDEFDCKTDMILQKGRKKNEARDVAIYLSRDLTAKVALNWETILATYPAPALPSGIVGIRRAIRDILGFTEFKIRFIK